MRPALIFYQPAGMHGGGCYGGEPDGTGGGRGRMRNNGDDISHVRYCAAYWELYHAWDACCALSGDDSVGAVDLFGQMQQHKLNCKECGK